MKLIIDGQQARVLETGGLVARSVEQYPLELEFSEDWAAYDRVIVFERDMPHTAIEVALSTSQTEVQIPHEVLDTSGTCIRIGAYGLMGEAVRPTIWTQRLVVLDGAQPGETAHEPTILPWETVLGMIGDLEELETEDRESLVAAVNWVVAHGGGGGCSWDDITDKPETFPPSAHTHGWSAVTDKPTAFPPESHSHDQSDVQGLADALAGKAAVSHTHAQSEVTDLEAALNDIDDAIIDAQDDIAALQTGKADVAHSHSTSDVTGLSSLLETKVDKDQGITHAGKALLINALGNVEPTKLDGTNIVVDATATEPELMSDAIARLGGLAFSVVDGVLTITYDEEDGE